MSRLYSSLLLRGVLLLLAGVLMLAGCSTVAFQQTGRTPAQTQASPAAGAQTGTKGTLAGDKTDRPTSEPYTGDLSIFEDAQREEKLQIGRVLDVLGIRDGASVADIGAGSGWFTVRASRRVGSTGTIYAVEINPDYIKHIEARAVSENLPNIRAVLGKEDDPMLPEKSVDAVLLLKTYHEIAQPVRLLSRLRGSLRAGARVGVIDRNGKGEDHGLDRETVVKEAARAGFALIEEHDFVKGDGMDYFLVFQVQQ